jgi:hypothetical protein
VESKKYAEPHALLGFMSAEGLLQCQILLGMSVSVFQKNKKLALLSF